MDCQKVGATILALRKEQNLTQKQLAERLQISDKTVSKWECGLGCPDVSLLPALSGALQVSIEQLLSGRLEPAGREGGNLKNIRFYVCPVCGNVMTDTGRAVVSCCGRKLSALRVSPGDEKHLLKIESREDEYQITFKHEMTKSHYLSFIAYVTWDKVLLMRLYPEQGNELWLPKFAKGKFYFGCNREGNITLYLQGT